MDVIYRSARAEDSHGIAELINLASGGIIEFLYEALMPEMNPVELLARGLEMGRYPYNYTTCIVAEDVDSVVGVSHSYPSCYHLITDKIREFFPPERIGHLEDFYRARVENSWFLESLGVDPRFQGKGIGSRLIDLTRKRALEEGYSSLSLLVFADNEGAIRLYRKKGFTKERHVRVEPHELIPHEDGCILMKMDLIKE